MSALPYIPLFVADYLADTSHLSTMEHGAYLLLIFNYWQRGKPLPCTDYHLARIARVTPREWQNLKPSLAPFFEERGEYWFHARIEAELQKVRNTSSTRSQAGKASAAAKAQRKLNSGSTHVEQKPNYTDTETDTKVDKGKGGREGEPENVPCETPDDVTFAVNEWNTLAHDVGLPKVQRLDRTRIKKTTARLKEIGGMAGWTAMLSTIRESPHLLGETPPKEGENPWACDFDWLIEPRNMTKVMEGKYLRRGAAGAHPMQVPVVAVLKDTPEWDAYVKSKGGRVQARPLRDPRRRAFLDF